MNKQGFKALARSALLSCSLVSCLLGAGTVNAGPVSYDDLYIFGDSLSDTGNTAEIVPGFLAVPAGFGSNNRFSNGPLWHEYLAGDLGLSPAVNSLGGGNNYSYGGARIDNTGGPSTGVLQQGNLYGLSEGVVSDPDSLYISWAGGNDMRDLVGSSNPLASITDTLADYQTFLSDLIGSGVTTLLVPNLPNLGAIPEFRETAESGSASEVTNLWNAGLLAVLEDLNEMSATEIFYFDVFSTFEELLASPEQFGFDNTTGECRSTLFLFIEQSCREPDTTVFWDEIHPTTAAHALLGQNAYQLLASGASLVKVSEPAAVLVMLMGLMGVFMRQRYGARAHRNV